MRRKELSICVLIAAVIIALLFILPRAAMADEYTASTMRLLRFEGTVEIEDASGAPRAVMENARFSSGESMRTGAASSASIGLDSSKIVTMDENSRVEFVKESKAISMTLKEGGLLLDVQEKLGDDESCDVKTATMAVGIRGTIVYLSAEDGDDEKNVRRIRVSGDGGQGTGAAADYGTAVSAGGGTADSGSRSTSTLRVLEGTAAVTIFANDGGQKEVEVSAGKKVAVTDLNGDGRADEVSEVQDMDESDLNMFVTGILRGDQSLFKRVESASDLLDFLKQYSSKGDWEWKEKVTLVAQSASKFYDGTPLTRQGDILVYGLPEQFRIDASAGGSQTDAGTSINAIGNYAIFNGLGEDVTEHFTNVEKVWGTLTVDPAPLTIWTGSASKYYDGKPLTNPDAGIYSVPGHKPGDPLWRNASYVAAGGQGEALYGDTQVLYGVCGVTTVHGTNPLTGETIEEKLYAGNKMTVFLADYSQEQSIDFRIEKVPVDQIPDELLELYADNPEMRKRACSDANWDLKKLEQRIEEVLKAEESPAGGSASEKDEYVTQKDLFVRKDSADRLMTDFTNVRITIDTELTDYSGRALGSREARYFGVEIDESIKVRATGSRTEVGSSKNTYKIDWGGANPDNYNVGEDLGTLTVRSRYTGPEEQAKDDSESEERKPEPEKKPVYRDAVTFTAGSAGKTYDGTELTNDSVTVEGLPEGFTYTAVAAGSQTDAGTGSNTVSSYTILDAQGNDVTSQFTNISVVDGTLEVEPLDVYVDLGIEEGERFEYRGEPYCLEWFSAYYGGEEENPIEGDFTYIRNNDEIWTATAAVFDLKGGGRVKLTLDGVTDAGEYTLTPTVSFEAGKESNYALNYVNNVMVIDPLKVIFDFHSNGATVFYADSPIVVEWFDATYDGETYFDGDFSYVEGVDEVPTATIAVFDLIGGGEVKLFINGIDELGEYEIRPEEESFESGNPDNYSLEYTNNVVTVMRLG